MNTRLKLVYACILAVYCLLVVQIFYWQVLPNSITTQKSSQYLKADKLPPSRGTIYDIHGNLLAYSLTAYELSLYKPEMADDIANVVDKLITYSPNLSEKDKISLDSFTKNNSQKWVTLDHLFDHKDTFFLKNKGFQFKRTDKRIYPELNLAKNIIGAIKPSQNSFVGNFGLERFYDKQLKGRPGYTWSTKDATGNTILNKWSWQDEARNGLDLHLSIDRNIQKVVEDNLKAGVIKYQADSGIVTVIDSSNGQIISMANYEASPSASFRLPAVTDVFEPGSIFKPLVMASALDNKSINSNYTCSHCDKPRQIGRYTIKNWDNQYHPNASLQDILTNSDNIGMSYIIDQLGKNDFMRYLSLLGLQKASGVDYPGEPNPIIKSEWSEIDLATAGFGQGVSFSQLQIATAFNVMASDGVYYQPSFLTTSNKIKRQVFNPSTTTLMKELLQKSVESGVVSKLKPDDMIVCAKSGTAQIASEGGYHDNLFVASYIGFFPCNKPKATMIVTINHPRSSPWGSSTAAPVWFDIASKLNRLL